MSFENARHVKLVAFTHPGIVLPDASALWNKLYGTPPQSFSHFVEPIPNSPPGTMAQGALTSGQGSLSVQMGKIEFTISPFEMGDPNSLPLIRDYKACLEEGLHAISKIDFSILRVAIVIEAIAECTNSVDAKKYLAKDIQLVANLPDDAIDISFSMNRRSQIGHVLINRLARWSIGLAQFYQFQVMPGSVAAAPVAVSEHHFAQLTVDINTAPLPSALPLPTSELPKIWEGLANEARTIISNGYAYLAQ